jgi:dipeptidase
MIYICMCMMYGRVANGFTIRQINVDDKDNFMSSANIFEVARRAKLWNPDTDGPFDFQVIIHPFAALFTLTTLFKWTL